MALRSPCISICRLDPLTQVCEGCLRHIDEIAAWGGLDEDGQRAIMRQVRERRQARREALASLAQDPSLTKAP